MTDRRTNRLTNGHMDGLTGGLNMFFFKYGTASKLKI